MGLYARLIAAVTLLTLILAGLWGVRQRGIVLGRAEIQAQWDKESRERTEAERSALFARVKNNERIAEQQLLDQQRIRKEVNSEVDQIHAAYGHSGSGTAGLRLPAGICSGSAPATQTLGASGGNAAAAGTIALPAEIARDLQGLMQEADTIVANCRATQQFIRLNGMYLEDSK